MSILITAAFFIAGFLFGMGVILAVRAAKRSKQPKHKYYSEEEMLTVNTFRNEKPASTNEEYSYQPDHLQ